MDGLYFYNCPGKVCITQPNQCYISVVVCFRTILHLAPMLLLADIFFVIYFFRLISLCVIPSINLIHKYWKPLKNKCKCFLSEREIYWSSGGGTLLKNLINTLSFFSVLFLLSISIYVCGLSFIYELWKLINFGSDPYDISQLDIFSIYTNERQFGSVWLQGRGEGGNICPDLILELA